MNDSDSVLIATDSVEDAKMISDMLNSEYANVHCSTDADAVVTDFESVHPDVLVLAFNTIEKSEHYSLELLKSSQESLSHIYRSILLSEGKEVQKAYRLCKKAVFDDYIVFWPLGHDSMGLPMAIHRALTVLKLGEDSVPKPMSFVKEANKIVASDNELNEIASIGSDKIDETQMSLAEAKRLLEADFDNFSERLQKGGASDLALKQEARNKLDSEIQALKRGAIDARLGHIEESLQPLRNWKNDLQEKVASQHESVSSLQGLADQVDYTLLYVDDDQFQHRLLKVVVDDDRYKLINATSAVEGLKMLRTLSPDLILLDLDMPEMNGLEFLSYVRSSEKFSSIPVIMATGRKEKEVVSECIGAGASDYIVKPFERQALISKIERCIFG